MINPTVRHNKVTEPEETEVCTVAEGDADKHSANGRRQISKIQSNKTIQDNDKGKTKRLQRRQSAKFKLDEPKSTLDTLKINNTHAAADDDDFQVDEPRSTQDSLKINNIDAAAAAAADDDDDDDDDDGKLKADDSSAGTSSSSSSSKTEDKEGDSFQENNKPQEHRKTSLSRPVREAAKKVQSYKEINLVVKMRRE
ncbi:putative shugoshin [Helianthus debilis subsp. tardiflorus]